MENMEKKYPLYLTRGELRCVQNGMAEFFEKHSTIRTCGESTGMIDEAALFQKSITDAIRQLDTWAEAQTVSDIAKRDYEALVSGALEDV